MNGHYLAGALIVSMLLTTGCATGVKFHVKKGELRDVLRKEPSNDRYIQTIGIGAADKTIENATQRRAASREAALVMAQYEMLCIIKGVHLAGGISVQKAMEADSNIATVVDESIRGAEVMQTEWARDDGCVVTLRLDRTKIEQILNATKPEEPITESNNESTVEKAAEVSVSGTTAVKKHKAKGVAGSFRFGGKVGFGAGWFSGSDWKDTHDSMELKGSQQACRLAGVFAEIGIIEHLALQPEILFSSKGGEYWGNYDVIGKGNVYVSGVEIPVYVKPKFKVGKNTLYGLIGPDIFLPLSQIKIKGKSGSTTTVNCENTYNTFILGLSGGLGYEHPLKKGSLDFAITYCKAISHIFFVDNTSLNDIALSIGYLNRK